MYRVAGLSKDTCLARERESAYKRLEGGDDEKRVGMEC
jgi:hypothetical protein